MRSPRTSAVVCIVAIIVISLYSAFTIDGVIASNAPPTVVFTLGTCRPGRDVLQLADYGHLYPERGLNASSSPCNLRPRGRADVWRQVGHQPGLPQRSRLGGICGRERELSPRSTIQVPGANRGLEVRDQVPSCQRADVWSERERDVRVRHQFWRRARRPRGPDRSALGIRRRILPERVERRDRGCRHVRPGKPDQLCLLLGRSESLRRQSERHGAGKSNALSSLPTPRPS